MGTHFNLEALISDFDSHTFRGEQSLAVEKDVGANPIQCQFIKTVQS